MKDELYRINDSVVEPEWTERGLAKLINDDVLVPVEIDYEAAWEYHLRHWGVITDTEDWRNHIFNMVRVANHLKLGPITGDLGMLENDDE